METEELLHRVLFGEVWGKPGEFNYDIVPLGTKPQTLGIYRFWRTNPLAATIVYPGPIRYREEQANFPEGRTWLIDDSRTWHPSHQKSAES